MPLAPGYGETPVPDEELAALIPAVREFLGESVSKAAIYDLEQSEQLVVTEQLLTEVLEGELGLDDLLTDHFVRRLHKMLYGNVWQWAGEFRRHEVNIGVAPEVIAVELRSCLGNIQWRWDHANDWTARQLGIATHAETVRIHPFTDGNGRSTRLLADLVFVAAQGDGPVFVYDWNLDKEEYIRLLRRFDGNRQPEELAEFVATQSIA
ncbi:Fic family protein [Catellatospora aurea]|uniref:Fic family protein n=1 Tax=Catellatospora aurea TaxID=1337874 RepID=A0ABW2H3T8_9ACTN